MNKTEFIRELRIKLGGELTIAQTELVLNTVLNTVARSVRTGEKLKIRGFGTFSIKRRRARVMRHPANGTRIWAHESVSMKFKPSPYLWKRRPYLGGR